MINVSNIQLELKIGIKNLWVIQLFEEKNPINIYERRASEYNNEQSLSFEMKNPRIYSQVKTLQIIDIIAILIH